MDKIAFSPVTANSMARRCGTGGITASSLPLTIAALALVLFAGPAARAQTLEQPRAFSWTGPYIGLHGGYASNGNAERVKIDGGLLAGLQAGYNLEVRGSAMTAVFGAEIEASYLWHQASRPAPLAGMIAPQWHGAAKLRYGLAFDRLLPFATAGLALVRRESISGDLSDSRWQAGYLFGAGVEYALTDTISIKAEYNYLMLGKVMGAYPLEFLQTRNFSTENVKLGLNLHF